MSECEALANVDNTFLQLLTYSNLLVRLPHEWDITPSEGYEGPI